MTQAAETEKEEKSKLIETLYQIDFQSLSNHLFPVVRAEDVVVLAQVHCVPSVAYLFELLIRYHGFPPDQIAVLPKRYSIVESAVASLKRLGIKIINDTAQVRPGQYDQSASQALSDLCEHGEEKAKRIQKHRSEARVILVDDGGFLTERWMRRRETGENTLEINAISVQQTASGVYREPKLTMIPKINVAYSAAKRQFESKIIAGGVLRKIDSLKICTSKKNIGIVGFGAIGSAVASLLKERSAEVIVYDKFDVNTEFQIAKTQTDLFRSADFIFGCTGRNWVKLAAFDKANRPINYISCSSRDVEFQNLLQKRSLGSLDNDEFGRIELSGPSTQIVENAGFPINFDREVEWEKPSEIGLTRALMLAGILQAMCLRVPAGDWNVQLSAAAQRHLVQNWLALCEKQSEDFGLSAEMAASLGWWENNSLGSIIR